MQSFRVLLQVSWLKIEVRSERSRVVSVIECLHSCRRLRIALGAHILSVDVSFGVLRGHFVARSFCGLIVLRLVLELYVLSLGVFSGVLEDFLLKI